MAQPKEHPTSPGDAQRRKDELIAELARARSGMALHGGQVRYQADVNRRLKASVKENVGRWIAGALVTGGIISLLPARERKVYVNPLSKDGRAKAAATPAKRGGGFWASFFKALVPLFKPLLTAFVTKQLANIVGGAKEAQYAAEHTTKAAENTARAAAAAAS
jgi:hypothetical protein